MFNESIYAFMLWISTVECEKGRERENVTIMMSSESLSTVADRRGEIKSGIKLDYFLVWKVWIYLRKTEKDQFEPLGSFQFVRSLLKFLVDIGNNQLKRWAF